MKKLILALTLLCAGALNGMEKSERGRYVGMEDLSPEVKVMIIQALNSYDNYGDVINAIKAMSKTNKELNDIVNYLYGNQKGFTALMHILADKFNETTEFIAQQFDTPAAKVYLDLANQLNIAIGNNDFDKALQLIKEGADVHYPAEFVIQILRSSKSIDEGVEAIKEASEKNQALHRYIHH